MKDQLRRLFFRLVPKYNGTLYTICKRYVDHFNGDNDSTMNSNGEIDVIRKNAKNWKVVFDVGAHTGEWSQAVLAVNQNVELHCFEPTPITFDKLQNNLFPNNVHLNQLALSAKAGSATMYLYGGSGLNSLYNRQWTFDGSSIAHKDTIVECTTLDTYCNQNGISQVDMLKMDIEGSELSLLEGADLMLSKGRIRCIQFEYDRSYIDAKVLLRDMFELLQSFGYELNKIYPTTLKLYPKYDQRLENFSYQNWIAQLSDERQRG